MTNTKQIKRALLSSVLALILCFTMLLGTTFAWFTDSVTSSNNIIQTGTLDITMEWADGAADPDSATWADASAGPIFNYNLWEPGYTVARHIRVNNVGTLALKYQFRIVVDGELSKLADVIDVYLFDDATKVARNSLANVEPLGTLSEVLGTPLSTKTSGSLKATDSDDFTLVLKMQESAGNEYQNLSLGEFSVQVIATQLAFESDSFDPDYDNGAHYPNNIPPVAKVQRLTGDKLNIYEVGLGETITLDTGYQFEPTESFEEVQHSPKRYWVADFAVSADKDVPANSMMLAGYYKLYADYLHNPNAWVGLTSDEAITAGTEINLLEVMGVSVNYGELCNFGNDGTGFRCGAVDINGLNAGTTLTVELRLYETYTADEAYEKFGNHSTNYKKADYEPDADTVKYYEVIGTFSYTFDAYEVEDQAGLEAALSAGITDINLGEGTYKMPSSSTTDTIKIAGTKDAVVDVTKGAYLDNATVEFVGVTIKTSTGYVMDDAGNKGADYAALYTPNVTYTNCTFEGPLRVGRNGAKFINCTFNNLGNDYVWTYGNEVTFEGCTFNTDGKAILIYSDGNGDVPNVTVKNCVFNSTQGAKAGAIANQNCAAIEIHNYGCGVNLVTEGNTYDANFSGEWRIKTYENISENTITVNGVQYTTIAIDGKTMTIDANKNVTVNQ